MTPFLQFVLLLALILLAAKLAGYLSIRLGQPSVLGELLVLMFIPAGGVAGAARLWHG